MALPSLSSTTPPRVRRVPASPLDPIVSRLRSLSEPDRGTVIGVTSAADGEGKTTIAIELARRLASSNEEERRVLLLDCSVQTESKHSRVEPYGKDFVGERQLVYCSLRTLLAPRETADTPRWRPALEQLRSRYAFVVLDLPSLLVEPIALELSRLVDRLFLVVRSGRTSIRAARDALERIGPDSATGVILNDARPTLPSWLSQPVR